MVDIVMIVKNEINGIQVTINSILADKKFSGRIFIYDTGSEDGTQQKAQELSERVIVGSGKFTNFAQARNDAHDWVITQGSINWILWLDANDEIVGSVPEPSDNYDSYQICQEWFPGPIKFYNSRLFKLTAETRWFGYVHEWIKLSPGSRSSKWPSNQFTISQNRLQNSESSKARWHKDVELLLQQVEDEPQESRYYFYLGRAYKDIGNNIEAKKWLEKRLEFKCFPEERFWAKYYIAEIEPDWNDRAVGFIAAFEECGRIEALMAAGKLYNEHAQWQRAFMVLNTAAALEFPDNDVLFVHRDDYDYLRWHLLGICAYYVKQFAIGKDACLKAIKAKNQTIDIDNLKWYRDNLL